MLDHREEVPADIPAGLGDRQCDQFPPRVAGLPRRARLHAGTRPQEPQFAIIEAKVALLCRAGFTPEHAVNLLFAVGRFVVGWVLEEQQMQPDDALNKADRRRYPLLCGGWEKLQDKGQTRCSKPASGCWSTAPRLRWRTPIITVSNHKTGLIYTAIRVSAHAGDLPGRRADRAGFVDARRFGAAQRVRP